MNMQQDIAICSAIADGWPVLEIVRTYGVSESTIRNQYGHKSRSTGPAFYHWCRRVVQDAKRRGIDLEGVL